VRHNSQGREKSFESKKKGMGERKKKEK